MTRILIVEDEPDAAESFALLLGISGHTVCTAGDGLQAIDAARDFEPDVAIVDIGLPGIDGYEVARRLRAEPRLERVLLIALSGYGEDEDKRRARAAGFDHHLTKPVELEQVMRLLAPR
ncbi:MAG: response regulator [Candidatus Binatia bacterium]